MMKQKFVDAHMRTAENYAGLSSARRLNVGCIIVKEDSIIGFGYNGMPTGWDNNCEHREETYDERDTIISDSGDWTYDSTTKKYSRLKTKPEVLHAESNALMKVARSTNSSNGATLFVTHAPCIECAKLIHQAGIKTVYYKNNYRDFNGINFLEKCGITVEHTGE